MSPVKPASFEDSIVEIDVVEGDRKYTRRDMENKNKTIVKLQAKNQALKKQIAVATAVLTGFMPLEAHRNARPTVTSNVEVKNKQSTPMEPPQKIKAEKMTPTAGSSSPPSPRVLRPRQGTSTAAVERKPKTDEPTRVTTRSMAAKKK